MVCECVASNVLYTETDTVKQVSSTKCQFNFNLKSQISADVCELRFPKKLGRHADVDSDAQFSNGRCRRKYDVIGDGHRNKGYAKYGSKDKCNIYNSTFHCYIISVKYYAPKTCDFI